MAVVKLTKTLIDSLSFATVSSKHIYYYDTELKGFGLRVTTQAKTYFVEGKIANRKTVRVSLEHVLKVQKLRFQSSKHQIYHGNMNKRGTGIG